jgi:hypothetical protein
MPVVVRLVQHVAPPDWDAYVALERQFADLESRAGGVRGRRLRPIAGIEPVDTLVWEAEYPSLAAALAALGAQDSDATHGRLFAQQALHIVDRRVELYDVVDVATGVIEP